MSPAAVIDWASAGCGMMPDNTTTASVVASRWTTDIAPPCSPCNTPTSTGRRSGSRTLSVSDRPAGQHPSAHGQRPGPRGPGPLPVMGWRFRRRCRWLGSARSRLLAGHLEGLVDLDGDPLAVGGGEVGLIDAVGVRLDPQDGRARVLGQGGRPDLGGGVAGEQLLVGPLALGLVGVAAAAVLPAVRGAVGAALVRD